METRAYKTYTLKVPQFDLSTLPKRTIFSMKSLILSVATILRDKVKSLSSKESFAGVNNSKKANPKKVLQLIVIVSTAAVTVYWLGKLLTTKNTSTTPDTRVSVEKATAAQNLGQEFIFPLKDSKGKKVTDMKIVVDSAELRNEIIVQGKRAVAVQGRKFLILTIKITNSYTKSLEINSRDYFRLTVNNKTDDLLAPEIHNDPVKVQPTSTKFARIGWPINDTDSQLTLLVGEIEGEKTKVELNLK